MGTAAAPHPIPFFTALPPAPPSRSILLNELTPGLEGQVAPTDCRLRPDQHCLEEGLYDQVCWLEEGLPYVCGQGPAVWHSGVGGCTQRGAVGLG